MHRNFSVNLNTDISALSFGTVKFGRTAGVKYPSKFNLPTDKEITDLLAFAQDKGINLLDTAPAYGTSEERLGKLLTNRKDWLIMGKAGENFNDNISSFDFSYQAIIDSTERSLKRLKTDYLDLLLLHSDGNDKQIMQPSDLSDFGDAVAALQLLKKTGKVRSIGISSKTNEGNEIALKWCDAVMLEYNLSLNSTAAKDQQNIIKKAQQLKIDIFIKKALASGHLTLKSDNAVKSALDFVFKQPVTSVVLGSISKNHWSDNCDLADELLYK